MEHVKHAYLPEVTHFQVTKCICEIKKLLESSIDINRLDILAKEAIALINTFESAPTRLDSHLKSYTEILCKCFIDQTQDTLKLTLAGIFYVFAKIRGFKLIGNYMSCDVYLIPTLVSLAECTQNDDQLFMILIWLGNLAIVPFAVDNISSSFAQQVYSIGLLNLLRSSNASKCQVASLILLSRLLSRKDVLQDGVLLGQYFSHVEQEWFYSETPNKSGYLMTINRLFKACPSEYMGNFIEKSHRMITMEVLRALNLLIRQNNIVTRYMIKLLGTLCLVHIMNGAFEQTEIIINNLMNDVAAAKLGSFDMSLRYAMAKSMSSICVKLGLVAPNYLDQLVDYMISQLEARNEFVDDSIANSHFLLLFLGYLALKRTISNAHVPRVIRIVQRYLCINRTKLPADLDSPIRDSSCFVMWALCQMVSAVQYRSLSSVDMDLYQSVFCSFVTATIMDTNLTIRKCAMAVVQEMIGRYGREMFGASFENEDELGQFIVNLIGSFDTLTLANHSMSFALIVKLHAIGMNRNIFVPTLFERVKDSNLPLEARSQSLSHLKCLFDPLNHSIPMFPSYTMNDFRLNDIVASLLASADDQTFAVCELLPLVDDAKILWEIQTRLEKYDLDKGGSLDQAVAYVKWSTLKIKKGEMLQDLDWNALFIIPSRFHHTLLGDYYIELFQTLNMSGVEIPNKNLNTAIMLVKSNNMIFARSLLTVDRLESKFISDIIGMIHDQTLNIETRHCLVVGAKNQAFMNQLEHDSRYNLVQLLDDYTMTMQGDVGSKLRLAIIQLISANIAVFHDPTVKLCIKQKLYRLSGELMDMIRINSFQLILAMDSLVDLFKMGDMDSKLYFPRLLTHYKEKILNSADTDTISSHFWAGFVHSLGSRDAPTTIARPALYAFLDFYNETNGKQQSFILEHLSSLLIPTKQFKDRSQKVTSATLNVFIKLYEANVKFPEFNQKAFYIRCYNLHINTREANRIEMILRIFMFLALSNGNEVLKSQCIKRLLKVAFENGSAKVRQVAGELLFALIADKFSENYTLVSSVVDIDWGSSLESLKTKRHSIETSIQLVMQ